jgi:hypothetical protein
MEGGAEDGQMGEDGPAREERPRREGIDKGAPRKLPPGGQRLRFLVPVGADSAPVSPVGNSRFEAGGPQESLC